MITIKDQNNLPTLIANIKELGNHTIEVGYKGDEKIAVIAWVHEFGATIKMTTKQRKKLFALISEYQKATGNTDTYKAKNPGHITIPERSFLRSTADDNEVQKKLVDTLEFYLNEVLLGKRTVNEALNRVGNILKNEIQSTIESNLLPEKQDLTKYTTGSDQTLIGTKRNLIKSITVNVK